GRLPHIEAERHIRHAFLLENLFNFFGRLLEQSDFRANGAAHSGITGKHMILVKPRTVDPVMTRGRAKIPNPGIAVSSQKTVPDQLVTSPFADDGARDIPDIVLIEAQHRAEARSSQRLPRAREPVTVKAAEVDAFFEVDLRRARGLKRPVPLVGWFEIVFIDGKEFRRGCFLRHCISYLCHCAGERIASAKSLRKTAA